MVDLKDLRTRQFARGRSIRQFDSMPRNGISEGIGIWIYLYGLADMLAAAVLEGSLGGLPRDSPYDRLQV